ncbi:MAG: class I SAM-dependent methyltransferase [Desulfobacterales bacterium]
MPIQKQLMESVSTILKKLHSRYQKRHKYLCADQSNKVYENEINIPQKVREMAETGKGTDACLELGCLPLLVNFYSPVPDINDLEKRNIWSRRSELSGIDFRQAEQLTLLTDLGRLFGNECKWPRKPTKDTTQFYIDNGSFSFGCAAGLHSMIRNYQPEHIFEIGSGFSSLVISNALTINAKSDNVAPCDYTIVDPYPGETVSKGLPALEKLENKRIELIEPEFFDQLVKNDILFVDSGHTVRTGRDVNYLILDVLPRLAPGVIIHFHDIPLPYEYQKVYFTNPAFRMFWTEAYLLQAFLTYNSEFEILLAMGYLMNEHMNVFCAAFPHFELKHNWANSGSFWIRRK